MEERGMGDNSTEAVKPEVVVGYIERIERLNEEMAALSADRSEVFKEAKEAKEAGLSTKAMREVIRWRKLDAAARVQLQDTIDLYMSALGNFSTTELGRAMAPGARAGAEA